MGFRRTNLREARFKTQKLLLMAPGKPAELEHREFPSLLTIQRKKPAPRRSSLHADRHPAMILRNFLRDFAVIENYVLGP